MSIAFEHQKLNYFVKFFLDYLKLICYNGSILLMR